MALRSIAQLKSWFRRGAYPTSEQFSDWMDSFFHKDEQLPVSSVDGLADRINGKYEQAAGEQLEREHTDLADSFAKHAAQNTTRFENVYHLLDEQASTDEQLRTDLTAEAERAAAAENDLRTAAEGKAVTIAELKGVSDRHETEIDGIQSQIVLQSYFKGYFSTTSELTATAATPNDYAYNAETGTKWIYDGANAVWADSGVSVPDQVTPPSDLTPLMDGEPKPGIAGEYARGDHRHPSDATKLSISEAVKYPLYYNANFDAANESTRTFVFATRSADGTYSANQVYTVPAATQTIAGWMSAADKKKLDGLQSQSALTLGYDYVITTQEQLDALSSYNRYRNILLAVSGLTMNMDTYLSGCFTIPNGTILNVSEAGTFYPYYGADTTSEQRQIPRKVVGGMIRVQPEHGGIILCGSNMGIQKGDISAYGVKFDLNGKSTTVALNFRTIKGCLVTSFGTTDQQRTLFENGFEIADTVVDMMFENDGNVIGDVMVGAYPMIDYVCRAQDNDLQSSFANNGGAAYITNSLGVVGNKLNNGRLGYQQEGPEEHFYANSYCDGGSIPADNTPGGGSNEIV